MKRSHKTYVLKLKDDNPKKELAFELNFQASLTTQERFEMMFKRSNQIKEQFSRNGYRKPFEIIKRI
jgi:hypothetical protein